MKSNVTNLETTAVLASMGNSGIWLLDPPSGLITAIGILNRPRLCLGERHLERGRSHTRRATGDLISLLTAEGASVLGQAAKLRDEGSYALSNSAATC